MSQRRIRENAKKPVFKYDRKQWYARWHVENGFTFVTLWSTEGCGPVALMWGQLAGAGRTGVVRYEIFGCFVHEFARRQGAMTFLLRTVFKELQAELATTQDGTESGEKFIKAVGFKQVNGLWMLRREAFQRHWKRKVKDVAW